MGHIFLSYARPNQGVAERLAQSLGNNGWEVFWDKSIRPGAEWNDEIQREIKAASCVIVLWSHEAKGSFWVSGEAAFAYQRGTYLPVRIDDSMPPRLFAQLQAISLQKWISDGQAKELDALLAILKSRIGLAPMYGNLEEVAEGTPVTEAHLHLVHSCWRVDKETKYGLMPYQIHVILYGHRSALQRVEWVDYRLPGYPEGHEQQRGGPRERLFELKELANGFCVLQAHVHLLGQPSSHNPVLRLSRLVNMSESGPRLEEFIRKGSPRREAK